MGWFDAVKDVARATLPGFAMADEAAKLTLKVVAEHPEGAKQVIRAAMPQLAAVEAIGKTVADHPEAVATAMKEGSRIGLSTIPGVGAAMGAVEIAERHPGVVRGAAKFFTEGALNTMFPFLPAVKAVREHPNEVKQAAKVAQEGASMVRPFMKLWPFNPFGFGMLL